jgi:predicted RecA/RadA family phage recombinase
MDLCWARQEEATPNRENGFKKAKPVHSIPKDNTIKMNDGKVSQYNKNLLENTFNGSGNWKGMDVPVFYEMLTDGTYNVAVPLKCPPDTMGFNKNYIFQMERKSKVAARLRAKLNK